jgi:hypothetical protein
MKSSFSMLLGIGLPLTVAFAFLGACSSGSATPTDAGTEAARHDAGQPVDTGPPPCVESKCFPGNKCLPDDKGNVGCQLPCSAQYGQTPPDGGAGGACPLNTTCTDFPAGTPAGSADRAFCVPDKTPYKSGPGLWGATCNPTGGIQTNPDCDAKQGFWCNARSPTDADAYCTKFQCASDADCRGGWWCATENVAPNASSNARSNGTTVRVCEPRNYCATCKTDLDCDSTSGVPEHCVADKSGTRSYCSPECTKPTDPTGGLANGGCNVPGGNCNAGGNCNSEAACVTLDQSGYCPKGAPSSQCVCAPLSSIFGKPSVACVGDGMLCSPCLSDADCKAGGGLCLDDFTGASTERYCSVPSGPKVPKCSIDSAGNLLADCPTTDEAPNAYMGQPLIGCLTTQAGYDPPNQCLGLVILGTAYAYGPDGGIISVPAQTFGCWTPNR